MKSLQRSGPGGGCAGYSEKGGGGGAGRAREGVLKNQQKPNGEDDIKDHITCPAGVARDLCRSESGGRERRLELTPVQFCATVFTLSMADGEHLSHCAGRGRGRGWGRGRAGSGSDRPGLPDGDWDNNGLA